MTQANREPSPAPVYSAAARHMHWVTAAVVLAMIPAGLAMTYRGNTLNIWDGLTNAMYSSHKLLGFLVLWLVAGRLAYRLLKGAPPDEPTLLWWQKAGSHLVHWLLYGLLLVVPLLGWVGISLYPSLTVFGLFNLPALAAPNEDLAKVVLEIHGTLAILMGLLACAHVGAALYHHLIRKDGVLRRMLPGLGPR
ncbi:cytochrome b [Bosea sp. (in: a-proteobacteria)]|uniref:cytochrome b n=1 Tax=Bosea sp. (in: a-proteobacteria) TaxID=1871050 RepID=UPI002B4737BA|nr:cytochrome b/b6 domain-containing protein [Bosea sp. (in: a-proteobacteria)]WRH60310.1 MAG: cytochrome b/b6 domain-containing protein [Bosea sp. (in: a-proteobacteria)]